MVMAYVVHYVQNMVLGPCMLLRDSQLSLYEFVELNDNRHVEGCNEHNDRVTTSIVKDCPRLPKTKRLPVV